MHESLMQYKPDSCIIDIEANYPADLYVEDTPEEEIINQEVLDLQAKCPDVIGWLTIPNTGIDYPFVQSSDNDYYLRRDIDGNYSRTGTIFIDYRCNADMSSQNTIFYGHNMKNDSMFGTMRQFNDKTFFDENTHGILYLPYSTFALEFFAYIIVDAEIDREVYSPNLSDDYYEYIRINSRHFRDIHITAQDRIITLSTCSYEFENARIVLLARAVTVG